MNSPITTDMIAAFTNAEARDALFAQARKVRAGRFGDKVFAYGFNYFSTYCMNKCAFCLYRRNNASAPRYRHRKEEIVRSAVELAESGVHLIDLTMGEDPFYLSHPECLVDVVESVSRETGLPVMVSPGVITEDALVPLREAGATWLALYQETFDRAAFAQLRIEQSYDQRMHLKQMALESGLLVEDGILTGWGDTARQLTDSLVEIGASHPSQVRVMTFVPQPGTPLAHLEAQTCEWEYIAIAIMRVLYPDLLIPASLDVEGPAGLLARLNAGANVITSIIPPGAGLEGVARTENIEDGGRTLAQLMPLIEKAGLELADQRDYDAFIAQARKCSLTCAPRTGSHHAQAG